MAVLRHLQSLLSVGAECAGARLSQEQCRDLATALAAYAAMEGPAVPHQGGREPAAVASEASALPANYIDPEHRGDDRELLRTFYQACHAEGGTADEIHLRGIRAVLATELAALRSRATPPPVEGKVVNRLGWIAARIGDIGWSDDSATVTRAAALLQQQATELAALRSRAALLPVPVGERLPRAADCDAEGRCWWFGVFHSSWALLDCPCSDDTHWLPHWAIPHPPRGGEVEG